MIERTRTHERSGAVPAGIGIGGLVIGQHLSRSVRGTSCAPPGRG